MVQPDRERQTDGAIYRARRASIGAGCEQGSAPGRQVRHDDLREAASRFVDALAAGREWLAERREGQAAALGAEVAAVKAELAALAAALGGGVFVDAGAAAAEVVQQLDRAEERVAALRVRRLRADRSGLLW